MCARVGNQRSRGVVTARVRTDAVQSFRHQHRDLHQTTYLVPLKRSGLILISRCIDKSLGGSAKKLWGPSHVNWLTYVGPNTHIN
jgi:hypothetical protein